MRNKPIVYLVLITGLLVVAAPVGADPEPFLVKDINPGGSSSQPHNLTNVNGTLFFGANDGTNGFELWKSDGTAAGTVLVKDIFPGAFGSVPQFLTAVNGTLFFAARDGTNGRELWALRVLTPEANIELLGDAVADLELDSGLNDSLTVKLEAALAKLQDGNPNNDAAAIAALEAFINQVQAQRGNKIPEGDADALIDAAQAIIDLLDGS